MFSATAIADFLACQHLTALNRAEAAGEIKRPFFADPGLDLLIRLGLAHEQSYLKKLSEEQTVRADSSGIVSIPTDITLREAAARTVAAIRDGAEVIYQATFIGGTSTEQSLGGGQWPGAEQSHEEAQWQGQADLLIRVDSPSALGPWS